VSRVVEQARTLTRAMLLRTARDVSDTAAAHSALVIAPHPDDETLGCGATILRKVAAGTKVTVLVVTDGRHSHRSASLPAERLAALREVEMAEAAARLGLAPADLRWGGLVDGSVADNAEQLRKVLEDVIDAVQPDEIYATCAADPHPDHAAVGRAARQVRRPGTTLYEYPVWLWTTWPFSPGNRLGSVGAAAGVALGRRAVRVRTGEYLAGKLHALDAHQSQVTRPAGVPPEEDWPVLPGPVLAAAAGPAELFFTGATVGR
jgi:LmbE family N-acetylglucosaminyl deacetylase